MALNGATTPLYRLAADAMIADLVPADERIEAYSIMRMGNNIGVALGPAIGGFIAAISYDISFTLTGVGLVLCGLLILFLSIETMPKYNRPLQGAVPQDKGYSKALKDRKLLSFLVAMTFNRMCSATLWLLLAVHAKTNFHIAENVFGFIPTTNAVMVILFQILVTRLVKRREPAVVMTLGACVLWRGCAWRGVQHRVLGVLVVHGDRHHWRNDPYANIDQLCVWVGA